ncbi:conserved protein of unknown function [Kyrpidia spormannii]|uniref:Uncharacterized protein n=1 Tax=Kyrpidia spormannii TaxID=2055160 RepID=A0ACA8Z909_9BACL|nr:conserved protein of unknown function [Kyrpidia spormannii]
MYTIGIIGPTLKADVCRKKEGQVLKIGKGFIQKRFLPIIRMLVAFLVMTGASWWAVDPPILANVTSSHFASSTGWTREDVEREAAKLSKPPQNARIDRVWKAIPDLNGIEVDVEETWKRVQSGVRGAGGGIPWVIRQVPAEVSLKDLPPAPIYRGNGSKKQMALMVNVSWGEEHVPDLLRVLDRHQVKATFFLDGKWVAEHGDLASAIAKAGHEIGTHGWGHPDLRGKSVGQIKQNLERSRRAIEEASGIRPALFAPPAGWYDDRVVKQAWGMGMYTIMWTLDTVDWKRPPVHLMVRRIVGHAEPGALVLMHPTPGTPAALEGIIQGLRGKGYDLVTVSNLLSPERPL